MRAALSALGLAVLAGCAGCSGPDLHPVRGTVTRGNKPVRGGVIQFTPVGENPRLVVSAIVGTDGTYTLKTSRTGTDRPIPRLGAPAGDYTVTFTPLPAGDGAAPPEPVRVPVVATVRAGDNDIPLRVPGP
jgi:hypothetical protein